MDEELGFVLQHQRIALDIDFDARVVKGDTTLKMAARAGLQKVHLTAGVMQVLAVTANGAPCTFTHSHALDEPLVADGEPRTARAATAALASASTTMGELCITLPAALPAAQEVAVRIDYRIERPTRGLTFLQTPDKHGTVHTVALTQNETLGARAWVPCVDWPSETATFAIDVTAPGALVCVCSGELVEQAWVDEAHTRKVWKYVQGVETAISSVGVCVGPLKPYVDETQPTHTYFCLPGHVHNTVFTAAKMPAALRFVSELLALPLPCAQFKAVFLPGVTTAAEPLSFASWALLPDELLHDERDLDAQMHVQCVLGRVAAAQWVCPLAPLRTWADAWLVHGMVGHIALLWERHVFGANHMRYHIAQDAEFVHVHDQALWPLHAGDVAHPAQVRQSMVHRVKSALVLHMVERRVGIEHLRDVYRRLLVAARLRRLSRAQATQPGQLGREGLLSTDSFVQLTDIVSKRPIDTLVREWVREPGCASLQCGYVFSKKKGYVEFAVQQQVAPGRKLWKGTITVRVHEADGVYDHVVLVDREYHHFDLRVHSKVRKNRRRREDDIESVQRDSSAVLWIRIDPEFYHPLMQVSFTMPAFMWSNMLEHDASVVSQYFAVRNMQRFVGSTPVNALCKVAQDENCFFGIRKDALYVLGTISSAESQFIGQYWLLNFSRRLFLNTNVAQPNDFSDLALYFVKKAVLMGLALLRTHDTTPGEAVQCLLTLLKFNDNFANKFSDREYVATLLRALGHCRADDAETQRRMLKQIHRYMALDIAQPGGDHTLLRVSLEALTALQLDGVTARASESVDKFVAHYDDRVRATALRCRVLLATREDLVATVLPDVMRTMQAPECPPRLRRALAQLVHQCALGCVPTFACMPRAPAACMHIGVAWVSPLVSECVPSTVSALAVKVSASRGNRKSKSSPTISYSFPSTALAPGIKSGDATHAALWAWLCTHSACDDAVRVRMLRVYEMVWGVGNPASAAQHPSTWSVWRSMADAHAGVKRGASAVIGGGGPSRPVVRLKLSAPSRPTA